MKSVIPSKLLKLAPFADAAVSGAVAVLQLAAADALSRLLLLPHPLLVETGVFLVAYAALLVVLARSSKVWSGLIGLIVIGNVAWAAGCVVLLVSGIASPTLLGIAFVAVQAIAVLLFAALEMKGLMASTPVSRPAGVASA